MDSIRFCGECGKITYWNTTRHRFICPYCNWESEYIDVFKGNEKLLDSFIDLVCDIIQHSENYENPKQMLKLSLVKLLNSL